MQQIQKELEGFRGALERERGDLGEIYLRAIAGNIGKIALDYLSGNLLDRALKVSKAIVDMADELEHPTD